MQEFHWPEIQICIQLELRENVFYPEPCENKIGTKDMLSRTEGGRHILNTLCENSKCACSLKLQ